MKPCRQTVHVGAGTHLSGKRVNQELIRLLVFEVQVIAFFSVDPHLK